MRIYRCQVLGLNFLSMLSFGIGYLFITSVFELLSLFVLSVGGDALFLYLPSGDMLLEAIRERYTMLQSNSRLLWSNLIITTYLGVIVPLQWRAELEGMRVCISEDGVSIYCVEALMLSRIWTGKKFRIYKASVAEIEQCKKSIVHLFLFVPCTSCLTNEIPCLETEDELLTLSYTNEHNVFTVPWWRWIRGRDELLGVLGCGKNTKES